MSRTTAYRWWNRYVTEGEAGLFDRSSRPLSCPHQTPAEVEELVVDLRRGEKLGPVRIGRRVGMPASTVRRVLSPRAEPVVVMDGSSHRPCHPPLREVPSWRAGPRRYQKSGRIPEGGGWRAIGQSQGRRNSRRYRRYDGTGVRRNTLGYGYIHTAVDDHSRLAYVEVLEDEKAVTAAGFTQRAVAWFADHGIIIQGLMTDNGPCYISHLFGDTLAANGIQHVRIPPQRPQLNGKVCDDRGDAASGWSDSGQSVTVVSFVRSVDQPWCYRSEKERITALADWIHT